MSCADCSRQAKQRFAQAQPGQRPQQNMAPQPKVKGKGVTLKRVLLLLIFVAGEQNLTAQTGNEPVCHSSSQRPLAVAGGAHSLAVCSMPQST